MFLTMKNLWAFALIILLFSCSKSEPVLELTDYDFEFKGFDWDPIPYKFSDTIKTSVLEESGTGMAATHFSYIADIENTLVYWDKRRNEPTKPLSQGKIDTFHMSYKPVPAIPYILSKTGAVKITIVNEEHHMAQTRVFTTQLLEEMYNQGYRHLGLETFLASPKIYETIQKDKYPKLNQGIYLKEPQFGQMIRKALQLGYTIFGYESNGHDNGKEREINQATNIKNYLDENPEGKILIHCGYAHGAEGEYGGSWERAMAARFTEFTGIDPLTINQTRYMSRSIPENDDAYYQITDVNVPSIYLDKDQNVFGEYRNDSYFDITVIHPKTKNFNRPSWLLYDDRKEVSISVKEEDLKYPVLLFAYLKGEEIGAAIPYDIQEMNSSEATLILEPGLYDLIFLGTDSKAKHSNLTVVN